MIYLQETYPFCFKSKILITTNFYKIIFLLFSLVISFLVFKYKITKTIRFVMYLATKMDMKIVNYYDYEE